MIGGVASGMAGYFGVDPVLVRLLWLVALVSGIGFFAYLVFWLIVPKAAAWPPPGYAAAASGSETGTSFGGAIVTGILVVALAALIGSQLGGLGDLVLPATLIGFGIYLLNQRAASVPPVAPASPSGALHDAALADPAHREPTAPEPTGVATPLTVSLLALGGGVAWALHSFGAITLSLTTAAAAALLIVGLGCIASLWLGRARGLVPLGVGLGAALLLSSATEPWRSGAEEDEPKKALGSTSQSSGEQTYRVRTLAELERSYSLAVGELTVDLRELDLEGTTQRVHAGIGIGELTVIVPSGVSVRVKGEVAIGTAAAFAVKSEGFGREVRKVEAGSGAGELIVDFDVGIGEGTVRHGA